MQIGSPKHSYIPVDTSIKFEGCHIRPNTSTIFIEMTTLIYIFYIYGKIPNKAKISVLQPLVQGIINHSSNILDSTDRVQIQKTKL